MTDFYNARAGPQRDTATMLSDHDAEHPTKPAVELIQQGGGAQSRRSSHSDVQVVAPRSWKISSAVFSRHKKSEGELKSYRGDVRDFYEKQNEVIQGISEVEARLQRYPDLNHEFPTTAADPSLPAVIEASPNTERANAPSDSVAIKVGDTQQGKEGKGGKDYDGETGLFVGQGGNQQPGQSDDAQAEEEEDDENDPRVRRATSVSLLCNVGLFILKLIIAIASGSLAVIASTLDSLLDLVSGFVLWYSSKKASDTNQLYVYPAGLSRAEPVGVLIFCAVMAMVSLQVIIEGFSRLLSGDSGITFNLTDLFLMLCVVITKFFLHLYCRTIDSPSAQALAQDHRNDIITNTFGLISAYFGANYEWWLDPFGAMLFSSYILFTWVSTGKETVQLVVGKTAAPEFIQQLTYVCFNHHPKVTKIDTVRAFHFGTNFLVEVDIVLPAEMPLRETHDIGESLQMKLEKIPSVERAFVHIDYEWEHKPEH